MALVDLLDFVNDVMPRRRKRYVAAVLAGACFLFPNTASRAVTWYAHERAQQIVNMLINVQIPTPAPVDPPTPKTPDG